MILADGSLIQTDWIASEVSLEVATTCKIFQDYVKMYRHRLKEPILIDQAVCIFLPYGYIPAIPCGFSRVSGEFDDGSKDRDYQESVFGILNNRKGFENLRITNFGIKWGKEVPYSKDKNTPPDHQVLGTLFGYKQEAIDDFLNPNKVCTPTHPTCIYWEKTDDCSKEYIEEMRKNMRETRWTSSRV